MPIRIAILIVIVALIPAGASADETVGTSVGPAAWLAAGALVVNGSVAVANGLSLAAGTSDRRNGKFGLVLGSTTMAVSALGLVMSDNSQSQQFSLVLGAFGMASAVTGMLSIKFATPSGENVSLSPLVDPFAKDHQPTAGLQLKVKF